MKGEHAVVEPAFTVRSSKTRLDGQPLFSGDSAGGGIRYLLKRCPHVAILDVYLRQQLRPTSMKDSYGIHLSEEQHSMESITLEVRPRLRSLSAYIFLTKSIDTSSIKVKLLEDAIEIQIEEVFYTLPLSSVKLMPSSLSSLGITSRWISFRIQTQPSVIYGTFESEIIDTNSKLNNGLSPNNCHAKFPPKNTDCQFVCSCCKNVITKILSFTRILPLPSSDCDPQEWFCCKHGSEESFSLDPGKTDLFYSVNYLVLNKLVFEENLKLRNSLVHCNRCLTILGSPNGKELKSLKIWNCCVEYQIRNDINTFNETASPLNDFVHTVKDAAELVTGERILLEAQDVNSIHYLLLRPMEVKLNVFTEDKINSKGEILKFETNYVAKVMYKYGESQQTTRLNDNDIKYCQLALPSISAGMDLLVSSSKRFPPTYRKAEDYYLGYLPL